MIVCLCRGVSDRTVKSTIADGAGTVDAVIEQCHAGSDCGKCRPYIARLLTIGAQSNAGKGETR